MDTIEFVVKDRKVVKSQLCKVINSIPALQISVIYPGDFSEEQQGSGVPISNFLSGRVLSKGA